MKHLFRSRAMQAALAAILSAYLKLVLATLRWTRENESRAEAAWASKSGVIVCFWHSRISLSPACWPLGKAQEPRALISLSPDGVFIAEAMRRLGFPAIRGSSRKETDPTNDKGGGAAFREVLKWIRGGGGVAITPDGPRGPAERMAEGAPLLGKLSGAPILFVGLAARPCVTLNSWDRAVIPLPFARGAIVWDGLDGVDRRADAAALGEDWTERLSAVTRRAEALLS